MKNRLIPALLLPILFVLSNESHASSIVFESQTIQGTLPVKTWKMQRDSRIVKQEKDFSCGAASIATILSEYYQRPTTEKEVLELLGKGDFKASFADMQQALPQLGFKGVGLATSWEQLSSLKIPVILYVKQRKVDHFTVVSGINDTHIKLSDSSLGNKILTRGQFKDIWETREEKGLEGKMLAILPLKQEHQAIDPSFFNQPEFSHVPTDILTIREP